MKYLVTVLLLAIVAFAGCSKQVSENTVYRTVEVHSDREETIKIISETELEVDEGSDILGGQYTIEDQRMRTKVNALGTELIRYFDITDDGLKSDDGEMYYNPKAYQREKAALEVSLIPERTKRAREHLAYLVKAIDDYHRLPEDWGDLEKAVADSDFWGTFLRENSIFDESTEVSVDPWGTKYKYKKVDTLGYELFSAGPDRELGTDDDIITDGAVHKTQIENERQAIGSLRTLSSAQIQFQAAHIKTNNPHNIGEFGTLEELGSEIPPFIDSELASGSKGGYKFTVSLTAPSGGNAPDFRITALPINPSAHTRTFFVDASGVVHGGTIDDIATKDSLPLGGKRNLLVPGSETADIAQEDTPVNNDIVVDETSTNETRNIMQQIGLSFKMFSNESRGGKFPPMSSEKGKFQPEIDSIYPEYMPDQEIIQEIQGRNGTDYVYVGWALRDEDAALAFFERYENDFNELQKGDNLYLNNSTTSQPKPKPVVERYKRDENGEYHQVESDAPKPTKLEPKLIFRLREGVAGSLMTDAESADWLDNPNVVNDIASSLPVMWQMPKEGDSSAWVLYYDGRVERVPYPGKFPMTSSVISRIRELQSH